jgi:hypothetical protein
MPAYPFSEIRDRLDDWRVFNNMVDSRITGMRSRNNSRKRNMSGAIRRPEELLGEMLTHYSGHVVVARDLDVY